MLPVVFLHGLIGSFADPPPVHLVAGARSRPGWHVPAWAMAAAAGYSELPGTGHMVMLEAPEAFGALLADILTARTP